MAKRKAFKPFKPLESSMNEEKMGKMMAKMKTAMKKSKGIRVTSKKTSVPKKKSVKKIKLKFKY